MSHPRETLPGRARACPDRMSSQPRVEVPLPILIPAGEAENPRRNNEEMENEARGGAPTDGEDFATSEPSSPTAGARFDVATVTRTRADMWPRALPLCSARAIFPSTRENLVSRRRRSSNKLSIPLVSLSQHLCFFSAAFCSLLPRFPSRAARNPTLSRS